MEKHVELLTLDNSRKLVYKDFVIITVRSMAKVIIIKLQNNGMIPKYSEVLYKCIQFSDEIFVPFTRKFIKLKVR